MITRFCPRHERALEDAVELRGLLRPTLSPTAVDPIADARQRIIDHAANFSGKAAIALLTETDGVRPCPLCFVNEALRRDARNPGLTVDDWVEHAADEVLAASIDTADGDQPLVRLA